MEKQISLNDVLSRSLDTFYTHLNTIISKRSCCDQGLHDTGFSKGGAEVTQNNFAVAYVGGILKDFNQLVLTLFYHLPPPTHLFCES